MKNYIKKVTDTLYKIMRYLLNAIEGEDNKLSLKRILAASLIISGIYLGWYGVKYRFEKLDPITMLIGVFFGAGLALLGITTWSTVKSMQMNNTSDSTTTTENSINDSKTISTDSKNN